MELEYKTQNTMLREVTSFIFQTVKMHYIAVAN